ncbi:MAG: hypothetical protein R3E84_07870 [Pseudomonadales bacterium]
MSWVAEHWVLVGLFAVYTTFLLRNAATGGAQARDASGYFVGGRKLGGVAVGISFFATFASTNSYVGHAGKSYAWGLPWLTLAVLIVLFTWLSWRAVAPRMRALAADFDALTLPDLLALRFPHANGGNLLRVLAGVVVVFCSVLYLVAIFKGAGNVFELFLDVPYETAVGITLLIVVAYTAIGGFVSVVRTDVVQGVMMVVGSIAMFYFVTRAAGGVTRLPELAESPETASLFQFGAAVPFAVLLGMSLSGAMKLLVDPRQLSRFFALRDAHQVNVGVWVAVVGIALIQFCLFPIGVYAHFLLQGRDGHGPGCANADHRSGGVSAGGGGLPDSGHHRGGHVVHGQCAAGGGKCALQGPCGGGAAESAGRAIHPDGGGGFCGAVRPAGAGSTGRHRRNHPVLRQPVCGLFLSSGIAGLALASWQRGGRHRVDGGGRDSAAGLAGHAVAGHVA